MRKVLLLHCLVVLLGMRGIAEKMATRIVRSWVNGYVLGCLYKWDLEKLGEKDMVGIDWQKTSLSNY